MNTDSDPIVKVDNTMSSLPDVLIKCRYAPYKLFFIDTGDYWILHLSVLETMDRLLKHLYKEMDISLEEYEYKTYTLKEKDYARILKVCSRVISNEKKTLEDLHKDVDGIMNYIFINESYAFQNPNEYMKAQLETTIESSKESFKISKDIHSYLLLNKNPASSKSNEVKEVEAYAGPEWFSVGYNKENKEPLPCYYKSSYETTTIESSELPLKPAEEEIFYVVYHKEYHISILVCKAGLSSCIWPMDFKHIPEFVWVDTFDFNGVTDKSVIDVAKTLFSKKYYGTNDALCEKIKAFNVLYNTQPSVEQQSDTENSSKGDGGWISKNKESVVFEKKVFDRVIAQNFILDNEPNHRMKASELYNQLCVFMGVPANNTIIHRRLQSYLIEAGLHKKRYTDGFYYFGIRLNQPAPTPVKGAAGTIVSPNPAKVMSLEEYMKFRQEDIQTLYPDGLNAEPTKAT